MEPNHSRTEGQSRGRRSYYGRRYQSSSQSWSQRDGGSSMENSSTADGYPRGPEEFHRNGASEQPSDSVRQRAPRGRQYYKQQVPPKENYRNREDFRRDGRRKGESQNTDEPYSEPSQREMPPAHGSRAVSTLAENFGSNSSAAGYANNYGEGEQASGTDFQSTQHTSSTRPSQKKNWQRDRNKRGFEKRPDHRDGAARLSEDAYERPAEPRDFNRMMEHQPYDHVRAQYPENGYRQKKWPSSGRGKFNRKPEPGYQERPRSDSWYNREEYRPRDEADHHSEHAGREESLAVYPRDVENDREYESSQASRRYDKKPPRFRGKQGGFSEPSENAPRQYESYRDKRKTPSSKPKENGSVADSATQLERLTHQLTNGNYECMVCFESVKQAQSIWNCGQCYHAFHLQCIQRWAKKSQDENSHWRCPGCQSVNSNLPSTYLCYCQKRKDPEWNRREVPHSCGEVCGKPLGDGVACIHTCTLLCHPGPCPVCSAQTQRTCPCGKTTKIVKCGLSSALLCGDVCGKPLACGLHTCEELCHVGPCSDCPVKIKLDCFCGRSSKEVPCSSQVDVNEKYCCDLVCSKDLSCGHHKCEEDCHPGSCKPCKLEVNAVKTCPCGKTQLEKLYKSKSLVPRKQCTDPVPVCGKICGREFSCGPPDNRHTCSVVCHMGQCPPCPLKTTMRCRCGRAEKDIPCKDLSSMDEVLCERRCNKKRQCGRHKCVQTCCIDIDHICPLVCGRTLSCGLHRCEALCHTGNCHRCHQVSFDELRCQCGTQVIYPPVPCGTRPPECNKPCTRTRPCGHPQQHNCHSDATCPPCTTLCEKHCYGKHELRKNIPCHVTEVSCGKPCGRALKCGKHTCPVTCHKGRCLDKCTQPCPELRPECGHPCALPCHQGACPGTPCREKIKVQCQCGQRSATVSCEENEVSYRKLATGLLASKMAQLQSGQSVDFKDLLGNSNLSKTKCLECNEECALVERNRRLALALQIKNPNPKPGAPLYTDFLKDWAKKDPRFAQMVHDKLTELVQLAKQSVGKMKSRSFSFEPMNRDKRQFIHEYCAFFGCESVSYDDEPKRNVVATAIGEVSFLPAAGIVDVVRRELGQRKMPAPPKAAGTMTPAPGIQLMAPQPATPVASAWGQPGSGPFRTLSEVVRSNPTTSKPAAAEPTRPQTKVETQVVDYFDFTS